MPKKKNSLVYLDVSVDGDPAERMTFELFYDVAPKTAENFRSLCTGEKGIGPIFGKRLHYKGSFFHRVVRGYMAHGGDFVKRDGTGGESIYGGKFPDESPRMKHDTLGMLSMPMADRDSHGSQFIITFSAIPQLDRKCIAFGKLLKGSHVLKKIDDAGSEDGKIDVTVKIINSGEIQDRRSLKKLIHKISIKGRRKKRRYYTSDSHSDSSDYSDYETDSSSDPFIDSDDESSDSFYSSSSDGRLKKRKKSSKKDKHKHKRRKDRLHGKKRRYRDKKSKRRSKRSYSSSDNSDGSGSESSSEDDPNGVASNRKLKDVSKITVKGVAPSLEAKETVTNYKREAIEMFEREEGEFPQENGGQQNNGTQREYKSDSTPERQPDVMEDHPGKSRSRSISPKRLRRSKSMSISPGKSSSKSRSPEKATRRSPSVSRKPANSDDSSSRSPPRPKKRSIGSPSPKKYPRGSSSRSPVRSSKRSISRSSGKAPPWKSTSRSPRVPPARAARRSFSRSPVRDPSRSRSPDASPKRIRRGRGFSQRYSYARRYRTPSPTGSPVRYRYGERDRYPSYRRYDRSPRRRYRSPPRGRTPPRYRGRRSRTRSRSVSASPVGYQNRARASRYSRSRSAERYRGDKRRSISQSRSRSRSKTSRDTESPVRGGKERARLPTLSPATKKSGLVSYGDGSPDSGR